MAVLGARLFLWVVEEQQKAAAAQQMQVRGPLHRPVQGDPRAVTWAVMDGCLMKCQGAADPRLHRGRLVQPYRSLIG